MITDNKQGEVFAAQSEKGVDTKKIVPLSVKPMPKIHQHENKTQPPENPLMDIYPIKNSRYR